jgi:hypothetical protein
MGSLVSGIFGGGKADEAGGAQIGFMQDAIKGLQEQFGETQANLQPFLDAGVGALPGVQQAATLEGLGQNLGAIFESGLLDELVAERTRAAQGQLAAGGLTRSGTALQQIADIPTQLGLNLEQMLAGRGSQLAGQGLNTALNLGQFGAANAGNIANLKSGQGAVLSSSIIAEDANRQRQIGNLFQGGSELFGGASQFAGSLFGGGGGGAGLASLAGLGGAGAGGAGAAGAAAGAGALFFSDPTLKENVEEIGRIGELGIYQWDWVPEAKKTIVGLCTNVGFMADEVKEHFPEFVAEFGGFDCILYPQLLEKLEATYG